MKKRTKKKAIDYKLESYYHSFFCLAFLQTPSTGNNSIKNIFIKSTGLYQKAGSNNRNFMLIIRKNQLKLFHGARLVKV